MRSKSWNRSCESVSERRIERPALLTTKSIEGSSAVSCSHSRVDRLEVGQVARVHVGGAAAQLDRGAGLLELVLAPGDQHRDAPGLGDLERGHLPDARGGAGDDDVLAGERRTDVGVAGGRRVEVLLPVPPERAGVGLEVGDADAGAGERLLGAPRVEDRRERGVRQDLGGDAQPADGLVEQRLHGRRPSPGSSGSWTGAAAAGPAGTASSRVVRAVDGRREPRCARRGAEPVDHVDHRLRLGVDQVEGLAVAVRAGARGGPSPGRRSRRVRRWCRRGRRPPAAARPAGCPASASSAGRSSRGRRPCPSPRSGSRRRRSRAGRPATAPSPPRARSARTRTSCGGTATAGAGPRRTSSRRTGPGTRPRRPRRTPGGSSRPAGPRRGRGRCGCRRRSASRWWRRPRSCRRSRRGGRSGRSRPGAR